MQSVVFTPSGSLPVIAMAGLFGLVVTELNSIRRQPRANTRSASFLRWSIREGISHDKVHAGLGTLAL